MSGHLSAQQLEALAADTLAPREASGAREHLAHCSTCSAALFGKLGQSGGGEATGVVSGPAPLPVDADDPATRLPRGSSVGRYVLLDPLGAGGMGVVYAAFDPELDRRVAIKLLQSRRAGSAAESWLLREAQAMARLSHPNVIAVHDVGVWNGRVFVAMELVDGQTLRQAMEAGLGGWRETVEQMIAAGRGLAAAHAAGIVHRDFKPENILLGKDGRVRVLDFGLARAAGQDGALQPPELATPESTTATGGSSISTPSLITDHGTRPLVSSVLTQAGMVMGTLPYMAPEQLRGQGPDARCDQFAFAVTLHEALYGRRPFLSEKGGHPDRWTLREPPPGTQVPPWIRRVITRALSLEPGARYGSLDELLAALSLDPGLARRRRYQVAGAAALVVTALAGTWMFARQDRAQCGGASDQVAAVWNGSRAEKIAQAFAATQRPFAASAAASVRRSLEAYASDWSVRRTEACEATRSRGEQTEAVMALKMACLDRRLEELASLAALFEKADGPMVLRASQAAAALSPLAGCADVSSLLGRIQPADATVAASAQRLSRSLALPAAHLRAGSFAAGIAQLTPLVEEARKLGYPPLLAEALVLNGELLLESGELKTAERLLLEAAALAQQGRADELGVAAWDRLAQTVGVLGGRFEAGRDAIRFAVATLERLGGRDDLQAGVRATRARLAAADGKYAEALVDGKEAVRLQQALNGEEHPATGSAINAVALAHYRSGELAEAEVQFRRALAIREKTIGPQHPDTSASLHGLASVLLSGGKFTEAREFYLRAVAIREASLGDKHPELAATLNNLAALHAMQGQFAQAQPYAERALVILEAVHGKENPYVAFAINNLGNLHTDQGRTKEALELHLRALAIREKTMSPDHSDVAMSLNNVADCLRNLGRPKEALERNLRAVAIREKVLAPGHKDLGTSLVGLGMSYLRLGRYPEATVALERGLKIRLEAKVTPMEVADARFQLAQALWGTRREKARVQTLAEEARVTFEEKKDARRTRELTEWLARQRW